MQKGELLGKMLVCATNAHAGQFDKAGVPYILHCLAVLHGVDSTDEEVQCIAVGHDLFEDTSITIEDLVGLGMTERIVKGIYALTKMPGQTHAQYKDSVKNNSDAILVKMSDLKHNSDISRLKGVTEKDIKRMAKYMLFYKELEALL